MMGERPVWRAWEKAVHAVKTSETGFEKANGAPFFEHLTHHPEDAALFDRTMVDFHGPEAPAVAAAYDFSEIGTIVDVGGGFGNLLAAILQTSPILKGVLFDLPHLSGGSETTSRCRAS